MMPNLPPIHRWWRLTFLELGEGGEFGRASSCSKVGFMKGSLEGWAEPQTAVTGWGETGWGKQRKEICLKSLEKGYWTVGCEWRKLYFSSNPVSFLRFSALGTPREQMLRKSLSGTACHKLHDNFLTACRCHKRLVVYQSVITSGAQGGVRTIAPSLMSAPVSFKWLGRKWDLFFFPAWRQTLQL